MREKSHFKMYERDLASRDEKEHEEKKRLKTTY